MVMNTAQLEELRGLLRNMDACARNLEQIAERERKAALELDAETLGRLAELRALSHQALGDMETQTRKLLARCGAAPDMQLGAFIDLHTPNSRDSNNSNQNNRDELQALRRNLYARMRQVESVNESTRLHLKASHDVAVGILQHIGAIEPKQTYGPRGAR